jgi:hypothetical protein
MEELRIPHTKNRVFEQEHFQFVSMTKTLEMLSSDIQGTLTVLEKLKDSNN